MKIQITADLNVVPFPRPNSNGKHRYNPTRYTEFKNALGFIAKAQMKGREPIVGPFKISAEFYKKSSQNLLHKTFGDLDNFLKAVLDSLNGICYADDAQCVEFCKVKKFKSDSPKIIIKIEEV